MQRSKEIDFLRAVAVLLVLGGHMEPWPASAGYVWCWLSEMWTRGGGTGVDLFFVLSGFLVSGLLFREHQNEGTISMKRFLIRRGLKIYPSFWLLIFVTVLHRWWAQHPADASAIWAELLFVQNYFPGIWGHTWSLAIEEHFYLLLVVLLALAARRPTNTPFRFIPVVFGFLALACLGLRLWTALGAPYDPRRNLFPTHLRIDSLFFGVLLSYLYHYHPVRFKAWTSEQKWPLLGAGVLLLAPAFIFPMNATFFIYTFGFTFYYLGAGCILAALLAFKLPGGGLGRALAYIGSHSYSIYLWHVPFLVFGLPLFARWLGHYWTWPLSFIVYLLGSLLTGILLAALVEFPVLAFRDRFFPSRVRPLATT
jgi:peptidoglycan/LPS O-acetylase OafA/YrhL